MAELIIAKHRNGALAEVKMQFIDKFAKFSDYEGGNIEPSGGMPSDYDYPSENSYTVPSKMNELPEEDQPF
jgi:replicative DNA helicase